MDRNAPALILSSLLLAAPADAAGNDDVEVIRAGDTVMYKYVDDDGQVVIQDHPPPRYFDVEPGAPAEEPVAEPAAEPDPVAPAGPAPLPAYLHALLWLSCVGLAAGGVYVLLQPRLRRRRNESAIARVLRRAGLPAFHEVAVNDGARRHAQVDCLVRTPSGLLVLGVERYRGTVSGTPEQRTWRLAAGDEVREIANPLLRVANAAHIVQALAPDVPVHARVVYSGRARFVNGAPPTLQRLSNFRSNLSHFEKGDVDKRDLDALWRNLMRFPRANRQSVRVTGGGWRRWLSRHGRTAAGAALLSLAAATAVVAQVLGGRGT